MEAALALPVLLQQPLLLLSATAPSQVHPNPYHRTLTLFRSPNLSLRLPAPLSSKPRHHQPQLRIPQRTSQLHPVPPQCPLQRLFQTGSHQPPHSRPGHQEVRKSGVRLESGQTVYQSELKERRIMQDCVLVGLFCIILV